jgi:hypothetical protein
VSREGYSLLGIVSNVAAVQLVVARHEAVDVAVDHERSAAASCSGEPGIDASRALTAAQNASVSN